jgi:hypothetical protein
VPGRASRSALRPDRPLERKCSGRGQIARDLGSAVKAMHARTESKQAPLARAFGDNS